MGLLTTGDSTPHRESTENSQQAVILFFGVIKRPSSGIHSGAGGIIQLGGVVHFVRHLITVNIFFQNSIDSSVCLWVSKVGGPRLYCDTIDRSHVPSTAF